MRFFRARIERGRIIVHEPVDVPDGVVYLAVVDDAKSDGDPRPPETKPNGRTSPAVAAQPAPPHHKSSS